MSQQELVGAVVDALVAARIPYLLTGSVVSSLQGEPRLTHDVDVLVGIRDMDISRLLNTFPSPRYYLDEQEVRDALATESMFNLIDAESGEKADFWILTGGAFDESRFRRRQSAHLFGRDVCVSTPEDTILAKLRWMQISGGSAKQLVDAVRVFEVQYEILDREYLRAWADELGIADLLARVEAEAELGG